MFGERGQGDTEIEVLDGRRSLHRSVGGWKRGLVCCLGVRLTMLYVREWCGWVDDPAEWLMGFVDCGQLPSLKAGDFASRGQFDVELTGDGNQSGGNLVA